MKKEIRFSGMCLTPDEQAVPDGALAVCGNAEIHNGGVRPSVFQGSTVGRLVHDGSVYSLLYIHEVNGYRHYISASGATLACFYHHGDIDDFSASLNYAVLDVPFAESDVVQVVSVGNTLVVLASSGLHYLLCNPDTHAYKYLGQKPPELVLDFSLSDVRVGSHDYVFGDAREMATYRVGIFEMPGDGEKVTVTTSESGHTSTIRWMIPVKDEMQASFSEAAAAVVSFARDKVASAGYFYAPFLLRYCYRLYDGSTLYMHSAPILMPVDMVGDCRPEYLNPYVNPSDTLVIFNKNVTAVDSYTNSNVFGWQPPMFSLQWRVVSEAAISRLRSEWGDIVKSVDVYISQPLVRQVKNPQVKDVVFTTRGYLCCKDQVLKSGFDSEAFLVNFELEELGAFYERVRTCSTFFLLKSFSLDDTFPTSTSVFPCEKSIVKGIAAQKQMTDDYHTWHILGADGCFVYNHRLNLYGVTESLFAGFTTGQMIYEVLQSEVSGDAIKQISRIVVLINTDSGIRQVAVTPVSGSGFVSLFALSNFPVSYPDVRAYRMLFRFTDGSWLELPLEAHPFLELAVHTGAYDTILSTTSVVSLTAPTQLSLLPNRVYTSEVDNPFYFPPEGINAVGTGTIVAISAATRALSEGQFGQFPLIVFATDGIWTMAVSSTGSYSAVHNVSREVVSNPLSVCQLDQSVVFATARAMNKITGIDVVRFSDVLDGPIFDASALSALSSFLSDDAVDAVDVRERKAVQRRLLQFATSPVSLFQSARVVYDFASGRLLFFPSDGDGDKVVLAYSIRSGMWSTLSVSNPSRCFNANPYPYLQYADGTLVRLDQSYSHSSVNKVPVLLLTRTITVDEMMTSVSGFEQRSTISRRRLPVLLFFGSRDGVKWTYIGRSSDICRFYLPGHSFRYFRVALVGTMLPSEVYSSLVLDMSHRLRKF